MSKIISCIDGSALVTPVCQLTAWVAKKLHRRVILLHALDMGINDLTENDLSGNMGIDSHESLLSSLVALEYDRKQIMREQGKLLLQMAQQQLSGLDQQAIESLQYHGTLLDSVQTQLSHDDLVIVGIRGESHQNVENSIGGQLEVLIRGLSGNILVAVNQSVFKPPTQFLFAYDASEAAKLRLAKLEANPLLKDLTLHVVMVGKSSDDVTHLQQQTAFLHRTFQSVKTICLTGEVTQSLTQYIADESIDLLVMGAYSHHPLRQWFLGSTTTAVLKNSPVPVLLLRDQ